MRDDTTSKDNIDLIKGKIEGSIVKNRFLIGRLIDKGSFGQVYKV